MLFKTLLLCLGFFLFSFHLSYTATSRSSHLTDANFQNSSAASGCSGDKPDPEFWMDRLNHLRAKANLAPHRNADGTLMSGHMMDNKVADENLSFNSMNSQKVSLIRNDVSFS